MDCQICNGKADTDFKRIEVWRNERWRMTITTLKIARGFCYLEPLKHISDVTELEGEEANEFGNVLGKVSKALKTATGAKLIYAYIYGDHISHLHVHLAPHKEGDVYVNDIIRSDVKFDDSVDSMKDMVPLITELRRAISRQI